MGLFSMQNLTSELHRLYLLPDGQNWHEQNSSHEFHPAGILTDPTLTACLSGDRSGGLNLVTADGLARMCAVDLDRVTDWPVAQRLVEVFPELGLPVPAISVSGRKGFGVWLSLESPVPAGTLRAFLRFLRRAYFPQIPNAGVDLRPDVAGPTLAAQAVMKLAPTLHLASGKWSGFIRPAEIEKFGASPWFETQPDPEEQAAILREIRPATVAEFMRAFATLSAQSSGQQNTTGPKDRPDFSGLDADQHPACISALLRHGAPDEMDYNAANLNLAAYCGSRGLSEEDSFTLARAMADHSDTHHTGKDREAKLKNFRSNKNPPPFHCDFARNTPGWRESFGGSVACLSCPAYTGVNFDNHTTGSHSAPDAFENPLLEASVALDLLAFAWKRGKPLPNITRVWPRLEAASDKHRVSFPAYHLMAKAIETGANASTYFREIDLWLSDVRLGDIQKDTVTGIAEGLLKMVRDADPSETDFESALLRARDLEKKAQLSEMAEDALKYGPDVPANVIAMRLRSGADEALKTEGIGGPLNVHRNSLFSELARTVGGDVVPTPFPRLNGLLHGGLKGGRLYVEIAPPKAGKTTLAAVLMDHSAKAGHPTLYVGFEMARSQMVEYALARKCQLNSYDIETRSLTPDNARKVADALESYLANEGQYLELWEAGLTTTLADAAAWAVGAKAKNPDKAPLIVVDYLQLARTGIKEVDSNQSETKRVSDVAVACKDLARRTGAAVLALSSVTKEAERAARTEGELDVTSARDSLAIIHAADGVLTLQTQTVRVDEGKGDKKTSMEIDPWGFIAQDLRGRGFDMEAVTMERAIERMDSTYPQRWMAGPDFSVRARLSLIRHRGRTGDVALYYRRGYHDMIEVSLPGLESTEKEWRNSEEAINVFREYANREYVDTPIEAPERPVEARNDLEPTDASPSPLSAVDFRYITDLEEALTAIGNLSGKVGIDFETTGVSPIQDQPRLLSLSDGNGPALVIDLFKMGGLHLLRKALSGLDGVAHNATFEMGFLRQHGGVDIVLDCTLLAEHLLTGEMRKLKDVALDYLGVEMDKTEQVSDWGADELTDSQLRYAAFDSVVVLRILEMQKAKLEDLGSLEAYFRVRNAQRAIVAMELRGMPFDFDAHKSLLDGVAQRKAELEARLAIDFEGVNLGSAAQVSEWITEKLGGANSPKWEAWPKTGKGQLKTGADELKQYLHLLPDEYAPTIRDVLLPYKDLAKIVSAFGESLSDKINPVTGRIHARFNLAGTATGRMSCSSPNLQQVPREAQFRGLFAAPKGRAFVIADYNAMELRCAAHVAGEEKLLEAFKDRADPHALTAAMLLEKSPQEWDAMGKDDKKQARQAAKATNFGLLYGQGAKGLKEYAAASYGVSITEEKARQYRSKWFAAYPAFSRWHGKAGPTAKKSLMVRTPGGRVRLWSDPEKFRETFAYNTPIQGAGAEAILEALRFLMPKLDGLDACPIAVVHDEIIVETSLEDAAKVQAALEEAMTSGMLAIFPEAATEGLVEAHVGESWADK